MVITLSLAILASACLTIFSSMKHSRLRYIFKPLTTILILMLALIPPLSSDGYRTWIALGLAFSLAGDILLMLPDKWFTYGLFAFLLAHLCYIAAFTPQSHLGLYWLAPLLVILASVSYYLWPRLGKFRVPVVIYELVIVTMAWRALARLDSLDTASSALAAVGALFFMASDILLAINRFGRHLKLEPLLVLGTYYLAQWLIALSA